MDWPLFLRIGLTGVALIAGAATLGKMMDEIEGGAPFGTDPVAWVVNGACALGMLSVFVAALGLIWTAG